MIEKWQALLNQLEIVEKSVLIEIVSEERLKALESKLNATLPIEYKQFCQVFGIGLLGYYMRIRFFDIWESDISINCIKLDLGYDNLTINGDILDRESINNLLDSAFVFGDNCCSEVVFWDLRTYSELDQSYDIYLANEDCFEGVYKVGRDFYEFIRGFCLGMDSYKVRLELIDTTPEELLLTFYPVELPSEQEKLERYLEEEKYIEELRQII